ncbi:RHS repeat protein [Pseudomonas sp. N3-W]|uniref:RHS repeat protein n=1 Tax=Pseudomonas sp. N3-W TaxID=2975049 RepID=UPI00217DBC59|nr:RHS repeat domain-containing protein [Pseudomonas sp. N3-W]UWF52175.1 RHS repeat protein [Pseudomonas sp. N3-W]
MSTSLLSKTPTITVIDSRGLTVRDIVYHRHPKSPGVTSERITRHQYDARGFLKQSADPRLYDAGLTNFAYLMSLAGNVLRTQSADAGTTITLNDAAGRQFMAVSNIGTADDDTEDRSQAVTRTWQYEDVYLPGRPVSVTQQLAGESARITERFVYAGNSDAEKDLNLAGECISYYDTAGLVQTDSIALNSVPLSVTRRLLKDAENPATVADWQGEDASDWNDLLAAETFITLTTADATSAVLTTTDAEGNVQRVAYNVAGLPSGSWLTLKVGAEQVIVQSLTYSAVGQKLRELHGNGVVTTYTYEAQTQRLTGIKTERPAGHASGAKVLQDQRYEYDPVGNVLSVGNDAEETRFWHNQKVVPENTYTYDSLYQLVSASGREMANAGRQGSSQPWATLPRLTGGSAYTNYTRTYTYDNAGNLTQVRHSAPTTNNSYTTRITVSSRSNRAVLSTLTENPAEVDVLFMAGGQQKQMQPGQHLTWTSCNELLKVTPVARDGAADDQESYRYDGGRQRILKVSSQKTCGSTQTQRVLYLPGLELRTTTNINTETESLQVIIMGQAVQVLHWESGRPAVISNDQIRYNYDNLIGSRGLKLDGGGNIISMEEYYPYGGTAILTARNQIEASYKTIRYSGKERDATGLYYYGYRYYQPWAGRWLSADPASTVDGLNLFRMVRNNPTTLNDLNGLQSGLSDFFSLVRKVFWTKKIEIKTSKQAIIKPTYVPGIKSRREGVEQQYKEAKARSKVNWLDTYQSSVRKGLLSSLAPPPNNALLKELSVLPISSENNNQSLQVEPISTVGSSNVLHDENFTDNKYIKNIGSQPLSIEDMRALYRNGVIAHINISQANANEKIDQLIGDHRAYRKHNEYLFALSESAGMRIMERGRLYSGADECAFHHHNIFLTRKDILSAGTIFVENNKISITNFSGHYKPPAESLTHVNNFLLSSDVPRQKFEFSNYSFNG